MLIILFSLIFSFFDIKKRRISIPLLALCYAASLIFLFFAAGVENLISSLITSALAFSAYFILWLLSRKKFGFGDVLYSALCGLFIPNPLYIWVFMLASVLLALLFLLGLWIFGLIFKSSQKEREPEKFRLPYIPFMSLSEILLLSFIRLGLI